MRPSSVPKETKDKIAPISSNASTKTSLIGKGCPKGTVPIRRVTKEDLLRARSFSKFGRKLKIEKFSSTMPYRAGLYTKLSEFYGAKANFNTWSPKVSDDNDYSDAEISLSNTDNNIQAGWMVNPKIFNDSLPRMFAYWTVDDFQNTGCLNILCPGFVQIGNLPLGFAMTWVSSYGDVNHQYEEAIHVYRDPVTHHWWLSVERNDQLIGYWPREVVTKLAEGARGIFWGGEAATPDLLDGFEMGSGHYPTAGYAKAAYINKIQYMLEEGGPMVDAQPGTVTASSPFPDCYSVGDPLFSEDADWGCHIYYGGRPPNFRCKD